MPEISEWHYIFKSLVFHAKSNAIWYFQASGVFPIFFESKFFIIFETLNLWKNSAGVRLRSPLNISVTMLWMLVAQNVLGTQYFTGSHFHATSFFINFRLCATACVWKIRIFKTFGYLPIQFPYYILEPEHHFWAIYVELSALFLLNNGNNFPSLIRVLEQWKLY